MLITNVQTCSISENPTKATGVTTPSFGMAKLKVPKNMTAEAGVALLTAGAAAVTGQVLASKSKRPTVKEISSECFDIQMKAQNLPELTKEELKVLLSSCKDTTEKCNKLLKKQNSPTAAYCIAELEYTSRSIKKQIASRVMMDVIDFEDVIAPDDEHISYYDLEPERLNKIHKQISELIEECDEFGSVSDELVDDKEKLLTEKKAIEIIPKLDNMAFEDIYAMHDGSESTFDKTIRDYMFEKHNSQYLDKLEEIEKKCSSYERGLMNYKKVQGNTKDLIKVEMINRYGLSFLDDIDEGELIY